MVPTTGFVISVNMMGVREGVEEVRYTYLETAFWNNYDGKTSPLKEDDGTPIVWYNEQKQ